MPKLFPRAWEKEMHSMMLCQGEELHKSQERLGHECERKKKRKKRRKEKEKNMQNTEIEA